MTYTSREVTGILGITYSQLLNFVHMSKPDDWTFTKVVGDDKVERYIFKEEDLEIFAKMRNLKRNHTYKEIKHILEKGLEKENENKEQLTFKDKTDEISINDKEVQVFNHDQFGNVRTIYNEEEDEVWFVAKDITDSLGLSNTTIALQGLEDFERTKLNLGRQGETNAISESGVYALIMRSRKEEAKKFRVWVTSEVLPSIRKSGGYIANQENSTPEQILANAVLVAQNVIKEKELQLEREKLLRQEAEETIKLQEPKIKAWEQLMDINKNLDMGATARAFNVSGLGRNNFMKLLREQEILQKNNNPYQYYMDRGYFEVIVIPNEFAQTKTVVTPKGLKWLAGKLVEWGYIG